MSDVTFQLDASHLGSASSLVTVCSCDNDDDVLMLLGASHLVSVNSLAATCSCDDDDICAWKRAMKKNTEYLTLVFT